MPVNKNMKTRFVKSYMLAIAVTFVFASQASAQLYRYIGDNGEVVIESQIPYEVISKGYEVLNSQGYVIEKVLPVETQASKDARAGERESARAKKEKIRLQKLEDEKLLERYSDSGDAVLARDRRIGALETMIVVVQGTINKLKLEEQKELSIASSAEQNGQEVPKFVLENLERVRSQIYDAEGQIEMQKLDQEKINKKFDVIIERLKLITGK